jgi:hypothetical protein
LLASRSAPAHALVSGWQSTENTQVKDEEMQRMSTEDWHDSGKNAGNGNRPMPKGIKIQKSINP